MPSFTEINAYIEKLASKYSEKLELKTFADKMRSKFNPTIDLSFQDEFLELVKRDGEFCIDSKKLREYGVLASEDIGVFGKRLKNQFQIDEDYELIKDGRNSIYMLTPDTFKTLLATTQKFPGQVKNPKVYFKYFLWLEKVFVYYTTYERMVAEKQLKYVESKAISRLNEKNDDIKKMLRSMESMISKQDALITKVDNLEDANEDLSSKVEDLQSEILYNDEMATKSRDLLHSKIDRVTTALHKTMNHLNIKSEHSTIDPTDEQLVTKFAVLYPRNEEQDQLMFRIIRGQQKQVEKVTNEFENSHHLKHGSIYIANSINLMINAKARYNSFKDDYIVKYNEREFAEVEAFNELTKSNNIERGLPSTSEAMIEFNRTHNVTLRNRKFNALPTKIDQYNELVKDYNRITNQSCKQLRKFKKITSRDIPIKVNSSWIDYTKNKHISYQEVIDHIFTMEELTKANPADDDETITNEL
jgi:hypothetical protein